MGPRVHVNPQEFLRLAAEEKGLIIKSQGMLLRPIVYVTRSGDYYYYTMSRQPVPLPPDCQVTEAKNVLL